MRVTDKMNFDASNRNMRTARSNISRLNEQLATQKRVTRPSDDPVAAGRILAGRVELHGQKQYRRNLEQARAFLNYADHSLSEVGEQLMRAKELTVSQAGDTHANQKTRNLTASEVEQIYGQVVQLANTQFGGRFLFGGYKTTEKPFNYNGSYNGDMGEALVHVDKDNFIGMNLPGSKVFHGQGLSGDGIAHVTRRQARTVEELDDQRAASIYTPDSVPLVPHLQQEGDLNFLQNDGKPENIKAHLKNKAKSEAIDPKTSHKEMPPDLILPDGSPAMHSPSSVYSEYETPLPEDEAMRIVNLQALQADVANRLDADAREIPDSGGQSEGRDAEGFKNYTGVNVFAVLNKLEIALKTNDKYAVQDSLEHIDEALQQVVMARAELGTRLGTIDSAIETMGKQSLDVQKNISDAEDADLFEVVTDLGKAQNSLKATLQTSGKLLSQTLFDFIR